MDAALAGRNNAHAHGADHRHLNLKSGTGISHKVFRHYHQKSTRAYIENRRSIGARCISDPSREGHQESGRFAPVTAIAHIVIVIRANSTRHWQSEDNPLEIFIARIRVKRRLTLRDETARTFVTQRPRRIAADDRRTGLFSSRFHLNLPTPVERHWSSGLSAMTDLRHVSPGSKAEALRQVVDAVAGLILRLDPAGRVTFASAGGQAFLGEVATSLVGRFLHEAVHPEDEVALATTAQPSGSDTAVVRMRDAGARWVATVLVVRNVPGTGDRIVTIREASEHERTHADLRASRDHYRALVDTLPQLVWMERADTGETVYVNQAFETYCGPIPTTRAARTDRFHPDDAGQIGDAYAKARVHGRLCEVQGRVRDRNGRFRWHQFVFRPLHMGSDLIGWLGSALDIDEVVSAREALAEKGELLRLAQEAAGAGLFAIDLATGEMILSPESACRLGLPEDRPAVVDVADWMRRVVPDDRATTLRAVREASSGRRTFDVAFRVPIAGGDRRWIQAIGRPQLDRDGVAVRIVGLTLDITTRKDGERALIEAKAAAEAARIEAECANAAKTEFLSAMSHEIRTPLNAVIGFAGLLAESERLDGDLKRYAELAATAGSNLRTIVDDILDFASVEAGAVSLDSAPFAVRQLVDACVGIVGTSAAAKGLDLVVRIDDVVPGSLVGDSGRLRQILLNLLNNAVKFTPRGSVTVSLRHEGMSLAGDLIRFSVTDTGIGISPDRQERLFRRFSQADSSIRRDYGGTGLGLAISRRLVELMGGTIGLVSEAGRGSTFWFTLALPLASAVAAAIPSRSSRRGRAGRILLVEDVEINRELACTVLRAAGHTVDFATDGIDAVRAVEAANYDLVLMDVQMPRLDGMMATRLIRCLPGSVAQVPVVALSANVLPDQVEAFRAAGMDDHFGKPFQPQELCDAVARWLDRSAGAIPDAEPTLDRERHADNMALIAPDTLTRLLGQFQERAEHAFANPDAGFNADPARAAALDPPGTAAERAVLRAEAHALAAASGLLGFMPLSRACLALERATEDVAFDELLVRTQALAVAAAAETRAMLACGLVPARTASGAR
ncbi:ATP-binding protein [Methylobacterium sp. J-070]|nr:ATP-binding protein [Methylobacterium sp. J-070]MCJ2054083.1 ATP-binding protein [Methylobacterium sp. J-070]